MKQCTLVWNDVPAAVSEINELLGDGWEIVPSSFRAFDDKRQKIAVLLIKGGDEA